MNTELKQQLEVIGYLQTMDDKGMTTFVCDEPIAKTEFFMLQNMLETSEFDYEITHRHEVEYRVGDTGVAIHTNIPWEDFKNNNN